MSRGRVETQTDRRVRIDGVQLHLAMELGPTQPVIRVLSAVGNISTLLRIIMGATALSIVLDELYDKVVEDTFGAQLAVTPGSLVHANPDSLRFILARHHLEDKVDVDRLAASVTDVAYTGSESVRSALASVLLDSPPAVMDTLAESLDEDWHLIELTYRNPLDFLFEAVGSGAAAALTAGAWIITRWQAIKKTRADIEATQASTEKTTVETEIARVKLGAEKTNARTAEVVLEQRLMDLDAAKLALRMKQLESTKSQDKQLDAVALHDVTAIDALGGEVNIAVVLAKATIAGTLHTAVSTGSQTVERLAGTIDQLPAIHDVTLE